MRQPGWGAFEDYVQSLIGLEKTIASGSKFYDPGDAVTRGKDIRFPVYAEAKYTEHSSKSLNVRELNQLQERAIDTGRNMIMPIRFWPRGTPSPSDFAVLGLSDLAELIHIVNGGWGGL